MGHVQNTAFPESARTLVGEIANELTQVDLKPPFGFVALQDALKQLDAAVEKINESSRIPQDKVFAVTESTLMAALPVLMDLRRKNGRPLGAARRLLGIWVEQARKFARIPAGWEKIYGPAARRRVAVSDDDQRLASSYLAALLDLLTHRVAEVQGASIIRRLRVSLGLSQDELGQALRVTGETVRRWEQGIVRIPQGKLAELRGLDNALSRVLEIFLPDRVSAVIRRPADLFAGQRALDWILQGRMNEVADRYDDITRWQA